MTKEYTREFKYLNGHDAGTLFAAKWKDSNPEIHLILYLDFESMCVYTYNLSMQESDYFPFGEYSEFTFAWI